MHIEFEYVVDGPVERVFPRMAEIEHRPEWVTLALERTSLADAPVGVGSRYGAIDQYPGRRAKFVQEITAYEPNQMLGESWGGPMAGHMTTRFVDEDGSTRLIVNMEINPAGALRFVAPLMKGWLIRELKKDYERFGEVLATEL